MVLMTLLLAAAPTWNDMDVSERERAMAELKQKPWPGRLAAATERFLGTRYAASPLGEGQGPDPDPLVRFDAVDCLTMVEESLALGAASDEASLLATLNQVRYSGPPSYPNRNHVMEAQWLPHMVKTGWLEDVTRQYGGESTRRVKKVITRATWRGRLGRALALGAFGPGAQVKGEFELDVIPAAAAAEALSSAPDGLVVVVVRADSPSMVTRVSHVGVLLHEAGAPVLRHASSTRHRVLDEPLADHLARSQRGSWKLEGVSVFKPLGAGGVTGGP